MTTYEVGELVDLLVRGATVISYEHDALAVALPGRDDAIVVPVPTPGVDVTRVVPKDWPPQPGDIWAETSGAEWFARAGGAGDTTVYLTSARQGFVSEDPDQILALDGPLRLVRRAGTEDLTRGEGKMAAPAEGSGAATAPGDEGVWIPTKRKGIDYHAYVPGTVGTVCGRSRRTGYVVLRSEAAEFANPCPRCYPPAPAGAGVA